MYYIVLFTGLSYVARLKPSPFCDCGMSYGIRWSIVAHASNLVIMVDAACFFSISVARAYHIIVSVDDDS